MVSSVNEAIQWLIKAANNKHIKAIQKLIWCYENGVGVIKSEDESLRLSKELNNLK